MVEERESSEEITTDEKLESQILDIIVSSVEAEKDLSKQFRNKTKELVKFFYDSYPNIFHYTIEHQSAGVCFYYNVKCKKIKFKESDWLKGSEELVSLLKLLKAVSYKYHEDIRHAYIWFTRLREYILNDLQEIDNRLDIIDTKKLYKFTKSRHLEEDKAFDEKNPKDKNKFAIAWLSPPKDKVKRLFNCLSIFL
jgi:hypothetical protein